MNHKQFLACTLAIFIVTLILTGCKASKPTLTFNDAGNQCAYTGPKTIPYGEFTLVIVTGKNPEGLGLGYAIITLKEGKTYEDLNTYPSAVPPAWVNVVDSQGPFTQNMSHTYNLSAGGNYTKGDPLYLVCFSGHSNEPSKIGSIGPIEVK